MLGPEIEDRVETREIGRRVEVRDEVGSTNELARTLAEGGAPHGTLVLARRQVAGRGRRGRTWSGLPGEQLFASFVLRPSLPPERAFELTLLAAVALSRALERLGARPRIKWPNDLELDGRKCAGILAELSTAPDEGLRHVVLGIGVNVEGTPEDFPMDLRERATTLRAAMGRAPALVNLVVNLCEELEATLDRHEREGFASVLEGWRARTSTLGSDVRVVTEGRELAGRAEDVDADGALLVRTGDGLVRVVAGEVVHLRKA
jgi:BirA family biotin operon repressor/biotin-[acetyl-CoA-carboxylase] ligase